MICWGTGCLQPASSGRLLRAGVLDVGPIGGNRPYKEGQSWGKHMLPDVKLAPNSLCVLDNLIGLASRVFCAEFGSSCGPRSERA